MLPLGPLLTSSSFSSTSSSLRSLSLRLRPTGTTPTGTGTTTAPSRTLPLPTVSQRTITSRIGQPHPDTHPHLLRNHEVTFGVTLDEYKQRRKNLTEALGSDIVTIIPAAAHHLMTNDIPYRYRQNSNFLYLSGFQEPGSVIVLRLAAGKPHFTMFVRPRDETRELWDGPRCGTERASEVFGADEVYPIDELDSYLQTLPTEFEVALCDSHEYDREIATTLHTGLQEHEVSDPKVVIERLRLKKSEAEVGLMREAGTLSGTAFVETMRNMRQFTTEAHVEGSLEFHCRLGGALRLAYPPVIATGISANTLHYVENDDVLDPTKLLLVDAGGEFHSYAADITRTFPIGGRYSEAQAKVYEEVLNIQKKVINKVRTLPSLVDEDDGEDDEDMNLMRLHLYSIRLVCEALERLGIRLSGTQDYRKYYPHNIGHYLGMDVHDTSSLNNTISFEPGMVVTVEPGLYLPDSPEVPVELRGIGVRIEDDVLVTDGAPEVLSQAAPKEISEIESIMSSFK